MFLRILPLAFILILQIITSSCAKKNDHKFKGKIISSCENEDPLANEEVTIYFLKKSSGLGPGGRSFEYKTTTDAEGNFTIEFEEKDWDFNSEGTYGAELIVKGRVVLSGISPSTTDLGKVLYDYPREVNVLAIISTSGLNPTDTVLISQEAIGSGNFTNYQDTIKAYLINKAGETNPVIMENRSAIIQWQIKGHENG